MHDQKKFGDHWSTGWQGEFGNTWELYKLVSTVGLFPGRTHSWPVEILLKAMACGCWSVGWLKCWLTIEALQAFLLSCKHLDLNICFLSKSGQIEDLKPQGNWPRNIPCYREQAGDGNRASLWCSLSTGAVKADVLHSGANCGSFWPSELKAGLSES